MFEEVVQKAIGRRVARRASWIGLSAVAHLLLVIWIAARFHGGPAQAAPDPVVEVTFVKGAARPSAPQPSRAAPAAPRQKPTREVPREPPRAPQAVVQPQQVPDDPAPHDPDEAHAPDDESRGMGILGGLVGGAPDGSSGAVSRPPQEFDAASMTRPTFLSGPDLVYTRRALERDVEGLMIVRCVVTVEGAVRACQVEQGLPYMDMAVVDALERRRYRPATRDGRPIEVTYLFRVFLRLPR